ncbi:hypothetical protein GAO06_28695, partial [Bacteroides thetaiotaomicron]
FYVAAVFLYSDIERNATKNFREKKILRVALSGSEAYFIYYMFIDLYIIYSYIIYIYGILSLFFFPIVLWYQFFVSGFQQLFVFGIKKEFFRVYQER